MLVFASFSKRDGSLAFHFAKHGRQGEKHRRLRHHNALASFIIHGKVEKVAGDHGDQQHHRKHDKRAANPTIGFFLSWDWFVFDSDNLLLLIVDSFFFDFPNS